MAISNAQAPLLAQDDASSLGPASESDAASTRRRSSVTGNTTRYISFAVANFNCLCAGSLTAYSLFGHIFQERLHYTQYQVNGCIVAGQLAMYLTVPIFGYLCDRIGPAPISLFSGIIFSAGYFLAAFTYRSGAQSLDPALARIYGWPYPIMVLAFLAIGLGTLGMYLSSVTTCAKNFGRGKYKGLALACPIASFGLSGMWMSQLGANVLYETKPDGTKGDVDVFKFFIFLAVLLLLAGTLGTFGLKIVDEEEMIDDAMESLEQSGLLDHSQFYQNRRSYGTTDESEDMLESVATLDELSKARLEEEARKKNWLLNAETRRFLNDSTMWWFAAAFFLVAGPGDTFINNLGTIIGTLYAPTSHATNPVLQTSPATHVSIVALTSTIARIFAGTITDILAPTAPSHQFNPSTTTTRLTSKPFQVSRITFLLSFTILMGLGQALLASGLIQGHAERFWIVSSLMGAGYGAVFSLTPIIITIIWGVENFGTNWGIIAMTPAVGALVWGAIYSGVYQWAAGRERSVNNGGGEDILCYGKECYAITYWAAAVCSVVACGMFTWAWRGSNGWKSRGIAV